MAMYVDLWLCTSTYGYVRRLMAMYGSEMCVMDATYNVCKCEVALFFVCVHMNVGYIIVGCFLLPSESVSDISRGLRILRQWILEPSLLHDRLRSERNISHRNCIPR